MKWIYASNFLRMPVNIYTPVYNLHHLKASLNFFSSGIFIEKMKAILYRYDNSQLIKLSPKQCIF